MKYLEGAGRPEGRRCWATLRGEEGIKAKHDRSLMLDVLWSSSCALLAVAALLEFEAEALFIGRCH